MSMSLEAIVIEIIREAILTKTKLTFAELTNKAANHYGYDGKSKGKALENRIKNIVKDERVLQQLQEDNVSENNISLGFKLGRVEIKGKLNLS